MQRPSTHTSEGPSDARLVVIRGAGSSIEAETMLNKMLANVLGVERADAWVVDIARDGRELSAIGHGVRSALMGRSPSVVVVLGVHATKAMLGEFVEELAAAKQKKRRRPADDAAAADDAEAEADDT